MNLLVRECLAVEIESQFLSANVGTFLCSIGAGHLMQRPMQQVGDGMVALDGRAVSGINGQLGGGTLLRHVVALDEMQKGVAGFLGVRNLPLLVADSERARVAHLAAHFGVKRCAIKHNTGALLFLNHFKDGGLGGQFIKPNELRLCTGADTRDANHFLFLRCPRPFPLLFHEDFESGGIHA